MLTASYGHAYGEAELQALTSWEGGWCGGPQFSDCTARFGLLWPESRCQETRDKARIAGAEADCQRPRRNAVSGR